MIKQSYQLDKFNKFDRLQWWFLWIRFGGWTDRRVENKLSVANSFCTITYFFLFLNNCVCVFKLRLSVQSLFVVYSSSPTSSCSSTECEGETESKYSQIIWSDGQQCQWKPCESTAYPWEIRTFERRTGLTSSDTSLKLAKNQISSTNIKEKWILQAKLYLQGILSHHLPFKWYETRMSIDVWSAHGCFSSAFYLYGEHCVSVQDQLSECLSDVEMMFCMFTGQVHLSDIKL